MFWLYARSTGIVILTLLLTLFPVSSRNIAFAGSPNSPQQIAQSAAGEDSRSEAAEAWDAVEHN